MNNSYNVGIYLRLSREDEKLGESGSIINQRSILIDYINKNNFNLVDEYVDDGVSGTTFDRKGFKRMIRDIENKRINMVITKDTSRLGRDHIEFGFYVERYFPENNVRYVAVCDNIDTFSGNNDMLLFKSAYNDLYVKDISNKIRASLNIKKRNGEFVGAYAPYGYKKDINNKHKLIIDEEAAKIVRRIFYLFIKGNSASFIANKLTKEKVVIPSIQKRMNRGIKSSLFGIWNTSTVIDILTNPTYMGNLTQGRSKKINYKSKKRIHTKRENWIISNNSCPAIVDKDVFATANNMYLSNKNKYKSSNDLLFKGLVYCSDCKHKIGFRSVGRDKNKIYGSCNYYLKHRIYNACTPHNIKYNILEELVIDKLEKLLSRININDLKIKLKDMTIDNFRCDKENKLSNIKKELSFIKIKLDTLYDDRLSGIIDKEMYVSKYSDLIKEKAEIEYEEKKILNLEDNNVDIMKLFDKFLRDLKMDKRFISSLIKKITYSENKVIDIYYNIKCL